MGFVGFVLTAFEPQFVTIGRDKRKLAVEGARDIGDACGACLLLKEGEAEACGGDSFATDGGGLLFAAIGRGEEKLAVGAFSKGISHGEFSPWLIPLLNGDTKW